MTLFARCIKILTVQFIRAVTLALFVSASAEVLANAARIRKLHIAPVTLVFVFVLAALLMSAVKIAKLVRLCRKEKAELPGEGFFSADDADKKGSKKRKDHLNGMKKLFRFLAGMFLFFFAVLILISVLRSAVSGRVIDTSDALILIISAAAAGAALFVPVIYGKSATDVCKTCGQRDFGKLKEHNTVEREFHRNTTENKRVSEVPTGERSSSYTETRSEYDPFYRDFRSVTYICTSTPYYVTIRHTVYDSIFHDVKDVWVCKCCGQRYFVKKEILFDRGEVISSEETTKREVGTVEEKAKGIINLF